MSNALWAIAAIPSLLIVGLAVYGIVCKHYRDAGYEPIVDYDALQAELDREFAPANAPGLVLR